MMSAEHEYVFIVNTNRGKPKNTSYETAMITEKKASAYGDKKTEIERIEEGAKVFLYASRVGIIAQGIAGEQGKASRNGVEDDEFYIKLEKMVNYADTPITYAGIRLIIGQRMQVAKTVNTLASNLGEMLWEEGKARKKN